MRLSVLGHLEASVDDRPVALGGAKQRAVLAMLGLEANRAVTADRLIEGLWGEQPPPSAAKMVQNYVWRLRRVLADDGGAEIVTRGRGVRAADRPRARGRLPPRTARLRGGARGRDRRAGNGAAREALALFRGDPLADVADEPFASAGDPPARGAAPDRRGAGDRRGPGRRPPSGGRRRDRRAAGREPAARAAARAADARAVPLRAPGRGARGLPPRAADAGRGDRRRAGARAAAPARRDPAPGPVAGRRAGGRRSFRASSTRRRRRR